MSKQKRISALVLALIMLTAVITGCGGAPAQQTNEPGPTTTSSPTTEPGQESEKPVAEDWKPDRPITIVVGFGAGGGVDTMTRVLAAELSSYLGTDVVVENMPGAGSGAAAEYAHGNAADGYTLLAVSSASATYAAMDNSNATYNEMDMLGVMVLSEPAFEVPATSPIQTMDDLINAWKTEKTTAANAGNGGLWHIPQLIALNRAGVDISNVSFVPYASGKEDATAIAKGEVDWGVTGAFLESAEFIKDGMSRALCIFSDKPYEIPGYGVLDPITDFIPEITANDISAGAGWRGIVIKKGAPENVYNTLDKALKAAYESDAFKELMTKNGLIPAGIFGEEANDVYEYTSRLQSWLLYDLGFANRSPEEVNVPRVD